MARDQINELDHYPFRTQIRDADGAAVEPTSLRWKLDCVTTQTSLLDWTDLNPGSDVDAIVPANVNGIVNSVNETETKRITVQANYDTTLQLNQVLDYDVVNNFAYA